MSEIEKQKRTRKREREGRETIEGGRGRLRGVARGSGRLPRRSRRWRPPRARVRAVSVLLAEEEEDKGKEEVGWAGWGGELGRLVALGKLGFSLLFCFFIYCFLFCRFVLNLVLKPIQFILLLTIFLGAKRI